MASVEATCQSDLYDIVSLALIQGKLIGIPADNIKIRMMPKVGEILDPVPCVIICSAGSQRPTKTEPFGFEGAVNRTYYEEIIVVKGFSGDYVTDNAKVQEWLEQVVRLVQFNTDGSFRTTLPNASTVYYLDVNSAPSFNRDLLNTGKYVYLVVEVEIKSSEISTSG